MMETLLSGCLKWIRDMWVYDFNTEPFSSLLNRTVPCLKAAR